MNLTYDLISLNQKPESDSSYFIIFTKNAMEKSYDPLVPYIGNDHKIFTFPVVFDTKEDVILYIAIRNIISGNGPSKLDDVKKWCADHIDILPLMETHERSIFYRWSGLRLFSGRVVCVDELKYYISCAKDYKNFTRYARSIL